MSPARCLPAACISSARRLDEAQPRLDVRRAAGDERRVLADAVPGDEGRPGQGLPLSRLPGFAQGREGGEADGHDGRLGIQGVLQRLGRSFEQEPGEGQVEG